MSYTDQNGKVFLNVTVDSLKIKSSTIGGEICYIAEQTFDSSSDEVLLGLGQFQDGQFNLRNISRRLPQVNTQIAIPKGI